MSTLTLKYDAGLPYQLDAIAAAVDLFAGQPLAASSFTGRSNLGSALLTEFGVGNQLSLDDETLLANLHRVQERNGIDRATAQGGRDFTVEMETGTGKTYVYLRTAFELHRTYGFRKVVIVVPSIAIREGVLHSIRTMTDHFRTLYNVPFDHATYDSRQLGRLRAFATANTLQLLVINIQAFQRDVQGGEDGENPSPTAWGRGRGGTNVIYRENDRLSGYRPIDFLRSTRPIVILDEPQKLSGEASSRAIAQLDPLCTLQYSATPDERATRIYRLGPIEAIDNQLVKRIEVASVREESNANDAYVRLIGVDTARLTARVEMNVGDGANPKQKVVTVRQRDDLFIKSQAGRLDAGRQEYAGGGYRVTEISAYAGDTFIEFANTRRVRLGQASGGLDDAVMRAQVHETIREHLEKERRLRPLGIKVLSLFFIDRVANYRRYAADGSPLPGKIAGWFAEEYATLTARPQYAGLIADPVERVHDGYFATDRKGGFKDSVEGRGNSDDESAYELIMRRKEQLLSLDEPLRFIFSHSALREGWDNPNVFQICTLNETRSVTRKRQEIGRGLRLPVNQLGERIHDPRINRLTVVANESYRDFARALQADYEQDGIAFGVVRPIDFAHLRITQGKTEHPVGQDLSRRIFDALVHKGHLDREGRIQRGFDPSATGFELLADDHEFKGLEAQITDRLTSATIASRIDDARKRERVAVQPAVIDDPAFIALWERVSRRTRFNLTFDTAELVASASARLAGAAKISPIRVGIDTRDVAVSRKGVTVGESRRYYDQEVAAPRTVPDVLAYLQNETDLTRDTLVTILLDSGRLADLLVNPQAFITMATREIKAALTDLMIPGIRYEPIADDQWELSRLRREGDAGIERYLNRLYRLNRPQKSPFPLIEYDSKVEERFAAELDANDDVRFFVKLPAWFTVDTPLGTYNPDWAIMVESTGTLYLVQETKGSLIPEDRRPTENAKIECATEHFKAIGVPYGVTTDLKTTIQTFLE